MFSLLPDVDQDGLTGMGYRLSPLAGEESGLNGILRQPDGSFDGGSDPRREGVVIRGDARP